jgi:protein SCO1/2
MSNVKGKASTRKSGKKSGAAAPEPKIPTKPLIVIGFACAALFAGFVAFTSNHAPAPASSAIGGPFQLTAHDNRQLTDKDLLGKPFLIFFGYTHCPDVCHTTLFEMSEILRALGPSANIGGLFVTIDPERDTPAVLKDYLSNFDPRIIGLSGAHEALDPMLKEYRIYAKRSPGAGDDYSVDHTTVVYLMNKDGKFVRTFNVARQPAEAARELAPYL